jgi:glycerate 2-kinase
MSLNILIAPSGFKESLGAEEVADCIELGLRRTLPDASIFKSPLVDGGEGFTRTLVRTTQGTYHPVTVTGPVGEPVASGFGFLGGEDSRTAVLEMAAAAGLRLVPRDRRDPLKTTTYGVGELIRRALDAGAKRILIGCGDSGTNDGGLGMTQALGGRFLDARGEELGRGGAELVRLAEIDLSELDPRLAEINIDVACNQHNVLCGPKGVARVFGPQKGASPETVELLESGLENLATVIRDTCGCDVRLLPGSGASGGLGAGLYAFLGATLHPRYEIVMKYLEFESLLAEADLVITAEGSIDCQTPSGKIPAQVAQWAKARSVPVVVIAGTIGDDAHINFECGIDAFTTIIKSPCSLSDAIENAPTLLTECAERMMRSILVGCDIARRRPPLMAVTPSGAPSNGRRRAF